MKSGAILLVVATALFIHVPALANDDAQSRAYFETGAKAYEKS